MRHVTQITTRPGGSRGAAALGVMDRLPAIGHGSHGCYFGGNRLKRTMCQKAATPSFQLIFFPSAYVRPE